MQYDLNRIYVENFKSLKNFDIEFNKFNVLIGSNGSGKTNVLELFKLINSCINPTQTPAYPFAHWWGFNNLVWSGDEQLPILFRIDYKIDEQNISYETLISGLHGKLSFVEEKLFIKDYVSLKRDYENVVYKFASSFITKNQSTIKEIVSRYHGDLKSYESFTLDAPNDTSILKSIKNWSAERIFHSELTTIILPRLIDDKYDPIIFFSPIIHSSDKRMKPLYTAAVDFLTEGSRIILLGQINYSILRQPTPTNQSRELQEDGSGLINLLFHWYIKNKKLPERFELALEQLFPKWQITFTVTDDGRILLRVLDGNMTLSPPSIPDGFYKLFVILAAIELNPRILLIDEMETSLHAEIIEFIVDSLKTCDANVIVTTHSPTVIDIIDLEDIIILEKDGYETTSRRLDNVDELKHKLTEKDITVSDTWLYGEL